ncbi:MAG: hypothetical protein Q9191_004112 [Dirinaria sp. TL-2023a]
MTGWQGSSLADRLASLLPKNCNFRVHHVSTPPTPCSAIYSALPGTKPGKTFCESQFLSVSVSSNGQLLQVYGLEVLIYTTRQLTTLFVSKADSTGYLYLLNLPKGVPSPLKTISSAFLKYLVDNRQRPDKRLVVSLFARAQNQYLFPGSIENSHKHVLDDRRLIKWWCQVLDAVVSLFVNPLPSEQAAQEEASKEDSNGVSAHGYLIVPGCDRYETASFYPKQTPSESNPGSRRWSAADPLQLLGRNPNAPERCLIPRFPDDPKARFLIDLDDELPDAENATDSSPVKAGDEGRWRSVRSLEQFWDLMSFRQECSAGRLVGFIWGVFTPQDLDDKPHPLADSPLPQPSPSRNPIQQALPTPLQSQAHESQSTHAQSPPPSSPIKGTTMPPSPTTPTGPSTKSSAHPNTSPIAESSPPKKVFPDQSSPNKSLIIEKIPETTEYYYWPAAGRGEAILKEKDYQRMNKLLLKQDYANADIAKASTETWLKAVAAAAKTGSSWGQEIDGRKEILIEPTSTSTTAAAQQQPAVATLNTGLIKKKKKKRPDHEIQEPVVVEEAQSAGNGTAKRMTSDDGVASKRPRLE